MVSLATKANLVLLASQASVEQQDRLETLGILVLLDLQDSLETLETLVFRDLKVR